MAPMMNSIHPLLRASGLCTVASLPQRLCHDCFFFGVVLINSVKSLWHSKMVATLTPGICFGELALLAGKGNDRRNATVSHIRQPTQLWPVYLWPTVSQSASYIGHNHAYIGHTYTPTVSQSTSPLLHQA